MAQPKILPSQIDTSSQFDFSAGISLNNNLVLPKTTNIGIKVDTTTPTFGWHDLLGQIQVRGTGAQDPAWNQYQGVIYQYQFTLNDEVTLCYHIPHDYVPGSDLFIHAHWGLNGAGITQNCTWQFDATYAKGYNQGAFPAVTTVSVLQASSTTQYQHMIAEVQLTTSGALGGVAIEVDGLILVRILLSANSGTGTGTSRPFMHTADIHYQSTAIPTKQKNGPGFYT